MRFALLACAVIVTGCLHAQATRPSARPASVLAMKYVNDPTAIDRAAAVAEKDGWRRDEWIEDVEVAYWNYYRLEAYALAAEVAYRFRFDPAYVAYAVRTARRRADEEFAASRNDPVTTYLVAPSQLSSPRRARGEDLLRQEIEAACRFGPAQTVRHRAVQDAFAAYEYFGAGRRVIYALFEYDCPLTPVQQTFIVTAALQDEDPDRALRYAERSFWTQEERERFVVTFFLDDRCAFGFAAAARLTSADLPVVEALETPGKNCESTFRTELWSFNSREQASTFFFAALKGEEYRLGLALAPFTSFTSLQAKTYLVLEAFRAHDEIELKDLYALDEDLKKIAFTWALTNGRARYVGNVSRDPLWERAAFDKLIQEGKYDDAAEIAEYGVNEAFRKHGIGLAFVAAVSAKDLDLIRYFLGRYERYLTEESYKLEWKKIHGDKPPELYPKRRKMPKKKPCPKNDDWEIRRCD